MNWLTRAIELRQKNVTLDLAWSVVVTYRDALDEYLGTASYPPQMPWLWRN